MKIWTKASTWLTAAPALLIAHMPAAHAGWFEDWLCRNLGICGPGGGNGDPTPVSEPEMLALLSTGLIVAGILAIRRRRK